MGLEVEKQSNALLTDLYQLTMAYGYWRCGARDFQSVFHLVYRKNPFDGGFAICAGLESVVDFIENFHFTSSDLDYLSTLKQSDNSPLFPEEFITFLQDLTLDVDVDAIPEGTVVFPQEPLIRVKGSLLQCQLLESPLLNLVNFPTLIATRAARTRIAAGNEDQLLEFGMRRAQGPNGAMTASRAAYIGGFDATSNVIAGKQFGIPVKGTHSHSWIMTFDTEKEAFDQFAKVYPANSIFLVDTYGTIEGVKRAIEAAQAIRNQGKQFLGIRLDSGDLAYLSIETRKMLDAAGFQNAKIVASNELDEQLIADLKRQGAKIDIWGVGTNLVTAKGHPALDGVYKLSAIKKPGQGWNHRLKLSEQMIKISNPGMLQVRRFSDGNDYKADMIWDELCENRGTPSIIDPLDPTREKTLDPSWTSEELLIPIFRKGKCVAQKPTLVEIRSRVKRELNRLHPGIKRFLNPHQYVVGMEQSFYNRKVQIIKEIRMNQKGTKP